MAKRAKGTGKSAAAEQAKAGEKATEARQRTAMVLIKAGTLQKLLVQDDNYKGKIDGLVGELRETIGNAVEKQHLDKVAYGLTKKFRRLRIRKGPEAAAHLYDTFLAYMELSGEAKLLEAVQGLPLDGEKNAAAEAETDVEETDEGDEGESGTVARPTFGGSRAQH